MNVSNSEPSDCINDVITRYNRRHGTSLAHVTLEQVLARSVVLLEGFLETLAEAGSFEPLLDTYYKRWLHTCVPFFHIFNVLNCWCSGQQVTLEQYGGLPVRIEGITAFGYLRCVSLDQSRPGEYELQPDGNSFDLMKNMISIKK